MKRFLSLILTAVLLLLAGILLAVCPVSGEERI